MEHVAVIGAGITGVTTAYALLTRGYEVTVLDHQHYPAMETSFANGGQLSASNAEVWNSVPTIVKGVRWIFRNDAPLLVNLKPSWHKYSWFAEFIWSIRNHDENTIKTTRLAIEARRHLFSIAEKEGIAFDLERRGILQLCRDKHGFDEGLRVNALLQKGGLERLPVSASEISSIEPALTRKYYGGFFTPSDSTGDIHKFTLGLANVCMRRGARFIFDAEVARVAPSSDGFAIAWNDVAVEHRENPKRSSSLRADKVVICAGCDSRRLAAMLGDRLNIYPVKGYSITVGLEDAESQKAAPCVSLLDEEAKIVSSRLGHDRLRVAGTAEFNGFNLDIRADRIEPLKNWIRYQFPGVATSYVVPWAGLRPMMPNMMPVVRAGRSPGMFYNTGHGHLGWTLSAATAEMVADIVAGGSERD